MPAVPKTFTYETTEGDLNIHPDQAVVNRLQEVELSDCKYGCKIYADPKSKLRVLIHSAVYGCPKGKKI